MDVEFYNPNEGYNPKINHRSNIRFLEETFTLKPEIYEKNSQCNAIINVSGIQDEQLIQKAYNKVKIALAILNRELGLHGQIYIKNAFITNNELNQIWGSTDAVSRGHKAVDEISEIQEYKLDYLSKLDLSNKEDIIVINLITALSEVLTNSDTYQPEKLWMILEATFGGEDEIQDFFINVYKIFLKYNYIKNWKVFFINRFRFSHPELHYELTSIENKKLGLENDDLSIKNLNIFQKNINILNNSQIHLISDIAQEIDDFKSDKIVHNQNVADYIKYLLIELYAQRNLTVHSNMSDDMFLLKQKEIKTMMNVIIEIFVFWYLKVSNRRSLEKTIEKIKNFAITI